MPAPTVLMISAVIIALGKSNAKLVAIVKANSLEIFWIKGAPCSNEIEVSEPIAVGQNHMLSKSPTKIPLKAPKRANKGTSALPFGNGISPDSNPIHPAANIWKGSHGPMPPVINAELAIPRLPTLKPKLGPIARPEMIISAHIGSTPNECVPNNLAAAIKEAICPSSATALLFNMPSAKSVKTTNKANGIINAVRIGAVVLLN